VDARTGLDTNSGSIDKPVKTVGCAAAIVNRSSDTGPSTIKIAPGVYPMAESVVIKNERAYSEKDRLTIEAQILPDNPEWKPSSMPVLLSVQVPRKPGQPGRPTGTYGLSIKISHVTIQGLKFLGSPVQNNWYNPVNRIGPNLTDLLVTQCLFIGHPHTLDIYCASLATGDRFVVDHCVFFHCHGSTVFWDGMERIGGKENEMRYCIVNGAHISGVWTCQTDEDFKFHHNIVTNSDYFWMRKKTDTAETYRIHDSIITNNRHDSGYGVESGPTGETGDEIQFDERNVIKSGEIVFELDPNKRNYLHVVDKTFGSSLGAGLFNH